MHTEYTRAVQRATEKEQRLQAEIKCVSPALHIISTAQSHII